MEINSPYTKKMIQEFKKIWDGCGSYYRPDKKEVYINKSSISTKGVDFVGKIKSSITDSI